jgi:sialate O-acetylesterase
MAVAIDVGEWNDIHPLNKKDVGLRLAMQARSLVYGDKAIVPAGPEPGKILFTDDHVIINFRNAKRLVSKDSDTLRGFAISSDGKKFVWTDAKIEKDRVIVSHKRIRKPIAVRYAWADNPAKANLYNESNLPATPFEVRKK